MKEAYFKVQKSLTQLGLPSDAILLYAKLCDIISLSRKTIRFRENGWKQWIDKTGKMFCRLTRQKMCEFLHRSEPFIRKMLKLLINAGLIREHRDGLTCSNKIYIIGMETPPKPEYVQDTNPGCTQDTKPCFTPDRNDFSPTKPEPKKFENMTTNTTKRTSGGGWSQFRKIPALDYTQREYTPEQMQELADSMMEEVLHPQEV